MSLLNLRKSTPSADPAPVSVDHFIDDALNYASGSVRAVGNKPDVQLMSGQPACNRDHAGMRRATFTLDLNTVERLKVISDQTGISRSRLIRIWVSQQTMRDDENLLCSNTV